VSVLTRRAFVVEAARVGSAAAALALIASCSAWTGTSERARLRRIGFLVGTANNRNIDIFRGELRALGWIEDESYAFDFRFSEGRDDRWDALVDEVVAVPVDVIVTFGAAAPAGKRRSQGIPVVAVAPSIQSEQGWW